MLTYCYILSRDTTAWTSPANNHLRGMTFLNAGEFDDEPNLARNDFPGTDAPLLALAIDTSRLQSFWEVVYCIKLYLFQITKCFPSKYNAKTKPRAKHFRINCFQNAERFTVQTVMLEIFIRAQEAESIKDIQMHREIRGDDGEGMEKTQQLTK